MVYLYNINKEIFEQFFLQLLLVLFGQTLRIKIFLFSSRGKNVKK